MRGFTLLELAIVAKRANNEVEVEKLPKQPVQPSLLMNLAAWSFAKETSHRSFMY